ENEDLKEKLSNAETNLLRCENLYNKNAKEKSDLHQALTDLKLKNEQLSREIESIKRSHQSQSNDLSNFRPLKWRSDRDLYASSVKLGVKGDFRTSGGGGVGRITNPYCPVCRNTKRDKSRIKDRVSFVKSGIDSAVDSGYTDRDSSPESVKKIPVTLHQHDNQEVRRLKSSLHKLKLKSEISRLTIENSSLKQRAPDAHCQCRTDFPKRIKSTKTTTINDRRILDENEELRKKNRDLQLEIE
uniref:Uncharacterized protein n=1 Tax=Romanomermis culicivorax TaxID=13658 RepID=A0A915L8V4_ROMCU